MGVMRAQASADMSNKKMLETLNAINKKVDDANLTLGDFASNKNKISCENSDLLRIVGALDKEAAGRENTLRLVAKAEAESQCWRQKYETDAVAKGEELEMTKMKLTARLTEAEAAIDNLNAKLNQVEKAKGK